MTRRSLGRAAVAAALAVSLVLPPTVGLAATDEPAAPAQPTPTSSPTAEPSPTPSAPEPTPTPDGATPTPTPTPAPAPTAPADPDADAESADDPPSEDAGDEPSVRALEAPLATLPTASRIGGNSRFDRSVLAARAAFPAGASTVIVANGSASVGPVIAASLAADRDAPLIYVNAGSLPSQARTEILRLAPAHIVAVGTDADFDRAGIDALAAIAPVERLFITSRPQASRVALDTRETPVDTVYLSGSDLRDHALAVAAAGAAGGAALLVNGGGSVLAGLTRDALENAGATRVVIVGDTSSVSSAYASAIQDAGFEVSRIGHSDDLELSLRASKEVPAPTAFVAVNPEIVWDVASGAALAAATGQPLVYTLYQCMFSRTSDEIDARGARVIGVGKSNWLRSAAVANTACRDEKPRLEAALRSAVIAAASRYDGSFAITVRELGRLGESAHYRGDARLEPASMMKLYAAYFALRRIQLGVATWDTKPHNTTLRTCLKVMIHASDNRCHDDIVHWIGPSLLNRMIRDHGFTRTTYGRITPTSTVLYAGNLSTTDDLTRFAVRLERGELLNPEFTRILLHYMEAQIFRTRIPQGLPASADQASKPGALWISSGLLQADTAIVRGGQTDFVISIIASGGVPRSSLSAIARAAYTHFNGSFGSAVTYPTQQMRSIRSVSLRSSPGGPGVGTLPSGRNVEVIEASRVWYQIRWGSRLLWVDSRALRNR